MEKFDWNRAIEYRNEWYDIYVLDQTTDTFYEYFHNVIPKYILHPPVSVCTILRAYKLFNSMSEEEQFEILLMGW